MLSWNDVVKKYITKHSDAIQRVTQPLRDHFGIGYFTHHRIDNNGTYTVLVDRPDWAEHYVAERIFLNDPYLRHPSMYQSGMSLIDSHGSEEYREKVLKSAKHVLDMDLGITVIQKQRDFVEFFGFVGNKKRSALETLYLNRPQILTSFAAHFKREFASILYQQQQEADSLINLKGPDFLCNEPICPDVSTSSIMAYYQDLGLERELKRAELLSLRERQCLKLLAEGKSMKEMAMLLTLSRRTIESYFENIKNKLICLSRDELLTLARVLNEIGYL